MRSTAAIEIWNRFWFARSDDPMIGVRLVTAATALWILLSRGRLWSWAEWPHPLISTIPNDRLIQFLLVPMSPQWELGLYVCLIAGLVAIAVGVDARFLPALCALLMYRFAAIETIFAPGGPYRQGLGQIVLILVVLAAFGVRSGGEGGTHRWGLQLARVVVAARYLGAGTSKLQAAGLAWSSTENMTGIAAVLATWADPVFEEWLAVNPMAAAIVGSTILAAELTFVLAVFSKRARVVLVPAVLAAHVLQYLFLGLCEMSVPLLLLFLPWEGSRAIRSGCVRQLDVKA